MKPTSMSETRSTRTQRDGAAIGNIRDAARQLGFALEDAEHGGYQAAIQEVQCARDFLHFAEIELRKAGDGGPDGCVSGGVAAKPPVDGGYYWVRTTAGAKPEIMQRHADRWFTIGSDDSYYGDDVFSAIGPIEMPTGEEPVAKQAVLFYCIEPAHLERLRAIAKRLYTEDRMDGDQMRDAAHAIMAAIRFAEALEALRGPGEPYVHMTPREDGE